MDKFYAVRQARSRIIGSRLMTEREAVREVSVWAAEVGPAVKVADSPEVRKAVHAYDQAALSALLYPERTPAS